MALYDDVALLLGRTPDPALVDLLIRWTTSAITRRIPLESIDPAVLDEVTVKAVVRYLRTVGAADGAEAVEVRIDDGAVTRRYSQDVAPDGDIEILDDWWELLGWAPSSSSAFTITPSYSSGWS